MARSQQSSSGFRIKRERTYAEDIDRGVNAALTRRGQPPARWGEYLPRASRKPKAEEESSVVGCPLSAEDGPPPTDNRPPTTDNSSAPQ